MQILRVNHAGEYGAIRIYEAQVFLARRFFPDLVAFLEETLTHEREHCGSFYALMKPRGTRPCGAMPLWGMGGSILGAISAMMGRNGIMICTSAVESTVHRHLNDQLRFLAREPRDEELIVAIEQIREQELGHLEFAQRHTHDQRLFDRLLQAAVKAATALLISLSTYGSHNRMKRAIRLN